MVVASMWVTLLLLQAAPRCTFSRLITELRFLAAHSRNYKAPLPLMSYVQTISLDFSNGGSCQHFCPVLCCHRCCLLGLTIRCPSRYIRPIVRTRPKIPSPALAPQTLNPQPGMTTKPHRTSPSSQLVLAAMVASLLPLTSHPTTLPIQLLNT